MVHLDPMVWLMMVVVAIGFVVAAAVLVELLPGAGRRESDTVVETSGEVAPTGPPEDRPLGGASP